MKELVEFFNNKKIIFKKMEKLDKKVFNIRSKVDIYRAVNVSGYHCFIYIIYKKSHLINSDIENVLSNFIKINVDDTTYKNKYLIINSSICSKARLKIEKYNWKIYVNL